MVSSHRWAVTGTWGRGQGKLPAIDCVCERTAGPEMQLAPGCVWDHWIFERLGPEVSEIMNGAATRKATPAGRLLFQQGDPADEIFVIKAGRVELTKTLEDGSQLKLGIREPGGVVGQMALLEKVTYPLTACCLDFTLTCGLKRHDLEQIISQDPRVGLQILRSLGRRLTELMLEDS